jgi:hypothetical protein
MTRRRAFASTLIAAITLLVAFVVFTGQDAPVRFESDEDHFKYGSIGTEAGTGVPYWIWQVLPRIFADKLPGPGGYAALGIVWEPGRELPIGFAKRNVLGLSRVGINCAFCHAATFRTDTGSQRNIVAGGPSHQTDPQAYARFLVACGDDPRFNAARILDEIGKLTTLSVRESLTYRFIVVPIARRVLRQQRAEYTWMDSRPTWGKGRIDPFNPVKFGMLKVPRDDTIGNADNVPVWNMKARRGMALHWDGLSGSLREVVLSSALGDGATRRSIDLESLERVERWISSRPPPPFPFPLDLALAETGRTTYQARCAECHEVGRRRTGTMIPIDEIGTDRHRLDMWTAEAADAYNRFGAGYAWAFTGFRKTNGYVAVPLDGVWLRAPYLHNGSVPYLDELLEPADRRTPVFYRGYDVYDGERVGFVSAGPAATREGFRYDTTLPGNGNAGHVYGTDLSASEKRALIEFLKTL